ncbi:TPA: portal protein [Yersinia enterocolitica]|nr:portal protein [Yersinia enterocolitica]
MILSSPNTDAAVSQPKPSDRFTQQQLLDISSDIDHQPDWRTNANLACAYYDGDQLAPEVVVKLRERGQPLTQHNLIAPTIDGVLGMEAKTRTDLMVVADDPDEEVELMVEAVNAEFADACRLSGLNKARSDAYADQIKAGLSWVEVRRNSDPFGQRFKVSTVHRNEIFWDWFSREADLSDCRWLLRKRWLDVDEVKGTFPDKAQIIDYSLNEWKGFVDTELAAGDESDLINAYEEYQSWSRESTEWISTNRRRVLLQVIYYRTFLSLPVMTLSQGRVVEYDKHNKLHVVAVATGRATLTVTRVSRVREAWFVGPHFLIDRPSSAPQGMFPLIPFWGYRKDKTGAPYGLACRAIPAQDEVNFRRIKLTWLLQAKRIIKDFDATQMPDEQLKEEAERPDGMITLNPHRHNKTTAADAITIQQDFQVAEQQFQVMHESMKLIQDGMGIYAAFLGQESNAASGVAISNLVEQGATTLAEINDNYQFACQQVGQLLLSYLLEDLGSRREYPVVIHRDDPRKRRKVMLNKEDSGQMNNDVSRLRAHIALAPIQQTPAYKSLLAQQLSEVIVGLPPEVQVSVLDMWVELLELPNKPQFIERLRGALGTPKAPDEMTPEEQQAAQEEQQLQQQQQALAMRELAAKVDRLEAEAKRIYAQAVRETTLAEGQRFNDAYTQAKTGQVLQEMQNVTEEIGALHEQMMQTIQGQVDQIPL